MSKILQARDGFKLLIQKSMCRLKCTRKSKQEGEKERLGAKEGERERSRLSKDDAMGAKDDGKKAQKSWRDLSLLIYHHPPVIVISFLQETEIER